jgi:hypothetical protein
MVLLRSFGEVVDLSLCRITVAPRLALEIPPVAAYEGRGHRIGEAPCLYSSEDWSTARAEFLYHHPALLGVEVRCTTLAGSLLVVDVVTHGDAAAAAGSSVEALIADPATECQRFVAAAFAEGLHAVRLPSARLAGGVNVIVQRAAALASLEDRAIEWRHL